MVLSFFRGSSVGLDHVVQKSVSMLAEARHSFDLATGAVLTGSDPASIAEDIRDTDQRINAAERELRSELVVHVTVNGPADIGEVLGLILLIKKIERIGDQAKNILDLAESGTDFSGDTDAADLRHQRQQVSALFAEAAELLNSNDEIPQSFVDAANTLTHDAQDRIDAFLTSDRPGHEVVPRAIYLRYVKRVVANLLGVVRSATEPISMGDDNEDRYHDLDD